jgi:hypothetical protein
MIPVSPDVFFALVELASEGRRSLAERLFIEGERLRAQKFLEAAQAAPSQPVPPSVPVGGESRLIVAPSTAVSNPE